jgi:hypothetical protein
MLAILMNLGFGGTEAPIWSIVVEAGDASWVEVTEAGNAAWGEIAPGQTTIWTEIDP